ncbi:MAG: MFS transporter, partial [Acidimicrobiales bacterium]
SAFAAVSPSAEVLIVARVVQGLGSAAMIPSSLSLALLAFPATRRSLAVGAWAGVTAIAGASGPPIGAALIQFGSWRLVFLVAIPIGVFTLVVGSRLFSDGALGARPGRLDLVSGPLAAISVGLVVAVLLQSATWGWDDPRVIAALVAAPMLMGLVVYRSARHPTPLLDLDLFRSRRFVVASSMTTLYNAAGSGYWLAAPLFLQLVWGWSVLASGLAIAPTPLTHALLAAPMGRRADSGAHRPLMITGALITMVGMAGLALSTDSTPDYWTEIFPFAILIGVGGAMAWPVFTSGALIDVVPEQYGEANGVNLTMRQLGAALGVAVVIAVIGNESDPGPEPFQAAWALAAAGLLVVAAVVTVFYPAGKRTSFRPRSRSKSPL